MSNSKTGVDQSRRFGFKESREQYEHRKKQEKQTKWIHKLSKENVCKLREELDSLERARFLTPQQNERKRLVTRMLRDLEAKNKPVEDMKPPLKKEHSPPKDSDSDDDDGDFLFSRSASTSDEDKRLFVPRKLRKREEVKTVGAVKTAQQIAEEAEKELLAAQDKDDDLDAFLDAL
jgi:phage-related minor tail protein